MSNQRRDGYTARVPHRFELHEQLEARILFDAVLDGSVVMPHSSDSDPYVPSSDTTADLSVNAATMASEQSPQGSRNEIVFVDRNVHGYPLLVADLALNHGAEVVFLDSGTDGIRQIASALENRAEIDAVHLIAHGSAGNLAVGNTILNIASMQGEHADQMTTIRSAMAEQGDLLVYGCNFSEGAVGLQAVAMLTKLTGADVAASDDLTGQASLGGDWDLETLVGTVETQVLVASEWAGLLAPPTATNDSLTISPGTTQNIDPRTNDSDPDFDPMTITHIEDPANPGVSIGLVDDTAVILVSGVQVTRLSADGTLNVSLPTDASETETFGYTVDDGNGGTDNGTITLNRDTDADSIMDSVDIDDDNDGILDDVEQSETTSNFYGTDTHSNTLYRIDPDTYDTVESLSITSTIPVSGTNGLDYDPTTGQLYTILRSSGGTRHLATLDPATGVATVVGQLSDKFSSITITPDGTLYGVTGEGADTPETLYLIDKTDASATFVLTFGFGDYLGENIEFNSDDNLLYRLSGSLQTLDLETFATTDTTVDGGEGGLGEGASTFESIGNGEFLLVNGGSYYRLTTSGSVTLIGARESLKGLTQVESLADQDGDGVLDYLDIDSDNDGITDNVEAQTTAGYIPPSGKGGTLEFVDIDGDGLDDVYDADTTDITPGASLGLTPTDTDSVLGSADGVFDYLDTDSDNDTINDVDEAGHGLSQATIDASSDSDNDGLMDVVEGIGFNDGFDVNDENLDTTDTNFNLADTDTDVATDGASAVPLDHDFDYRDITSTLNNVPRIDLNSIANPSDFDTNYVVTFVEADSPQNVVDGTTADIDDASDNDVILLTMVIDPLTVVDGASEKMVVGGRLFDLSVDSAQTGVTVGGTSFNLSYIASSGAFTIINNTGGANPMDQTDLDILLRGITYENTSSNPTLGNRNLTVSATDSGGLVSNTASSIITVVPVSRWSITGGTDVDEGGSITYTVTMDDPLTQSGENAMIDLSLTNVDTTNSDYAVFNSIVTAAVAAYTDPGSLSWNGTTLTFTSNATGAMGDLEISLVATDDMLVEGSEAYTVTLSNPSSSTGEEIASDPAASSVTTTINDTQGIGGAADQAHWSVVGSSSVDEGAIAQYTLSLSETLQSSETATIDLGLGDVDTTSADYASFVAAVNAAVLSRPEFTFDGSTLTYTGDGSPMADLVIHLSAVNDSLVEGSEDFSVVISSPGSTTGGAIAIAGSSSVTTTINDTQGIGGAADQAHWSVVGSSSVDEGAIAQYTLSLSETLQSSETATIDLGLGNVDTTSADYASFVAAVNAAVLSRPEFTFDGSTLTYTGDGSPMADLVIHLGAVNDSLVEGSEDFSVVISSPGSTTGGAIAIAGSSSVTTTINDTQGIGGAADQAHWSVVGSSSVDEGAIAQYTLSLSETLQSSETATIDLGLGDVDTTSADYASFVAAVNAAVLSRPEFTFDGSTLTYTGDGSPMADLVIHLGAVNDSLVEGSEDFSVVISSPGSTTGGAIAIAGSSSVTTTINDTQGIGGAIDGPAQWSLSGPSIVDEGDLASYTIHLSGIYQAGETVSVAIDLNDVDTNGLDYDNFLNAIQVAADANTDVLFDGSSRLTYAAPSDGALMTDLIVHLPIVSDGLDETMESFMVVLSSPSSSTNVTTSLGIADITTTITGPPIAGNDVNYTSEGNSIGGNLLTNDRDPDNDALTIKTIPVTDPANGTITLGPDGSYLYTPSPDFSGTDSVAYQVLDSNGNSDTGILTIYVSGIRASMEFGLATEVGENFAVPVNILVENVGSTPLDNLNLIQDLRDLLGPTFNDLTTPTVSAVGSFGGTLPGINGNWVTDTSQNIFDGSGVLHSEDRIEVSLSMVVDPDATGSSTLLVGQASVTARDPNHPSNTVADLSDSGNNPATMNLGKPGDTGGSDDATPLLIGDAGLAERLVNISRDPTGFQLTIEVVLENTGTTHLDQLRLHDDFMGRFGPHFGVVEAPQIIQSTAAVDPNLNVGYLTDTQQNIFDGNSGELRPGESLTVRLTINVVSNDANTVELVNQATGGGRSLNPDQTPVTRLDNSPLDPVIDSSDSGNDPNGNNPTAAGDTGGYDDPTTTRLTFFTWDSFGNTGSRSSIFDEPVEETVQEDSADELLGSGLAVRSTEHNLLSRNISVLAPEPIYSGAARPGTQIVGRIYSLTGQLLSESMSIADTGGNWMMRMHGIKPGEQVRVEFVEVVGEEGSFGAYGDIYGYLGVEQHSNDYAAMQSQTTYGERFSIGTIFRQSAERTLGSSQRFNSNPLGLGG